LLKRFTEFGGEVILGKMVKRIEIENNKVKGVILNDGQYISSAYIVSACDVRHTFFELIEGNKADMRTIRSKISKAIPSSSFFLVYLGIDKKLEEIQELKSNIFLISSYNLNLEEDYANISNCHQIGIRAFSVWDRTLNSDDRESICLVTNAYYKIEKYWNERIKECSANSLVKLAERVIPYLSKYIKLKITATPYTLYKWTLNYQGAAYGWASTPEQFGNPDFSQKTNIENLYLAGHWSNQSSGVTLVANCGYNTANLILEKERL
jgi:phytoene dehydrogenase-like protein